MKKKIFEPEKYGMVTCPGCLGQGYLVHHSRDCCPMCGGFGYIKKETEKPVKTPANKDVILLHNGKTKPL